MTPGRSYYRGVLLPVRNWLRSHGWEVSRAASAPSYTAHLTRLFEQYSIDLVIDVGARMGDFGLLLRENGYSRGIVSFEPASTNFRRLRQVSDSDSLWQCHQLAIGSRDGRGDLNVTELSHLSSFRKPSNFGASRFGSAARILSVEAVELRRLDTIWAGVIDEPASIFLKVDTQGWDLEVLSGAGDRLSEVTVLQIEISFRPLYEDVPTWLESLSAVLASGFEPAGFFPVLTEPDGRLVEMDCIAIRRGDSPKP